MKYLILFLTCLSAYGATLLWDASETSNVTYRLKWGPDTNQLPFSTNLGLVTSTRFLTNGPWGAYWFGVTAVSSNGIESLTSNQVYYTNRPAAPLMLKIQEDVNNIYIYTADNGSSEWIKRLTLTNNQSATQAQIRAQLIKVSSTNIPPPFP